MVERFPLTQTDAGARHTEGPWHIAGADWRYRGVIRGPNGEYLAKVNGGLRSVEAQANAYLMAAAPELLVALRESMQWIENWTPSFADDPQWTSGTRAKVLAAMAAAEGRS